MIFVDTNVVMYAVGREHAYKQPSREFFAESLQEGRHLATNAEVLQELLYIYKGRDKLDTLDRALELVDRYVTTVWAVEEEDVRVARDLVYSYPSLSARDLVHVATCRRRGVRRMKTFDQALAAIDLDEEPPVPS